MRFKVNRQFTVAGVNYRIMSEADDILELCSGARVAEVDDEAIGLMWAQEAVYRAALEALEWEVLKILNGKKAA